MKVLLTGGTGFVGSYVAGLMVSQGDKVTIVSRNPNRVRTARAGIKAAAWLPDLSGFDAVVHLAGENLVSKRWNARQKELLRSSRVDRTRELVEALAAADPKPKVFVCASAIGYYGSRPGEELTEASGPGDDYLAKLCADWEAAAREAEERAGIRTVRLRIGVVLGPEGGALQRMLKPFRMGVGGPLGNGRQLFSWIHQRDLGRMILWAIENESVRGALNGVGPNPVTAKEFAKTLGRVLHRPAFLPVPIFALKLALGEVADVLAADQKVLPERASAGGFEFQMPELEPALRELLQRYLIKEQV